jgi:hypothetical protein
MPAISPPTALGGLVPFGGAPISNPTIALNNGNVSPGVVQQTTTGASNVSGPTTYTHTFASTLVGSTLVIFVAVNASAGAALGATPAGWTLQWSQVVATLALGCYVYYNNPGAITAFTLGNPTATAGGISSVGYEVPNCPFPSDVNSSQTGSSTSAASGAAQLQPPATNNVVLGCVAWVRGSGVLTVGNTTPSGTIAASTSQINSVNGTSNVAILGTVAIQPAMASGASTGFIIGGTISVSSVWNAGILNLRSLASDYSVGSASQDPENRPSIIAGGQQAMNVGAL